MKVLHLANGNMFGGIERFLVTLAQLQQSNDTLQNEFLLSHRGRLSAELELSGARPNVLDGARLRNPLSVLRARRGCCELVDALRPDIVVAHGPWAYVVFAQGLSP